MKDLVGEERTSATTESSPLLQSAATRATSLTNSRGSHKLLDADKLARTKEKTKKGLQKYIPIISWLPKYTRESLLRDIIAGLTVGLMVVPQGLAYATIAGLPIQYGLYTSYMGCFVYCVFGSSKDITLGPTAIMSLMVDRFAQGQPLYAIALTLLCGIFQLLMGVLRLGFLVRFISLPVISGFVSAAAIIIGFGQVKSLLGLKKIPREFDKNVYETFKNIGKTNLWDFFLGSCCIVILLILKKLSRVKWHEGEDVTRLQRACRNFLWVVSIARNALVVIMAALLVVAVYSSGHAVPFSLTGEVPSGIPDFKVES